MCTLNQFSIPHGEESLAARLVEIYFSFFKVRCLCAVGGNDVKVLCVSFLTIQGCVTKTDLDGKMLSALLTGVNRAFPFIKGKSAAFHWCYVLVVPQQVIVQRCLFLFQRRPSISRRPLEVIVQDSSRGAPGNRHPVSDAPLSRHGVPARSLLALLPGPLLQAP